jgi:hypothetical protein
MIRARHGGYHAGQIKYQALKRISAGPCVHFYAEGVAYASPVLARSAYAGKREIGKSALRHNAGSFALKFDAPFLAADQIQYPARVSSRRY